MMLYRLIVCWAALFFLQNPSSRVPNLSNDPFTNLNSGVVVERVTPSWSRDKAGIKAGDVLLRWSRGLMSGDIASPFDLEQIEVEQQPRGAVTLEGLRDTKKFTWVMGADRWKITARPQLAENLLAIYREARKMERAHKAAAAVERLRTAAVGAHTDPRQWLSSWFLLQAAELSAAKQQWKESDTAYAEAIQRAEASGLGIRAQLWYAWATSYKQRREWANAEKYYQQSIAENQKLGDESLTIAENLHNLGYVALARGDLVKAEEYDRQAMEIRQRLAPGSLGVAASLNSLGVVARARGDLALTEKYYQQALDITQRLVPDSLDVAASFDSLGAIAHARGNLALTEKYYQQALEIRQKLAPGSPSLAATFNNLGFLAEIRGDLARAEKYYQQALDIRQKLAPEGLAVAESFIRLGFLAKIRGDLARAEQYYNQALSINQKLAPESFALATNCFHLGLLAKIQGDLARAEKYYHQALNIRQKLAPRSVEVASSLDDLGIVAEGRGNLALAEKYFRQALEIGQKFAPRGLDITLLNLGFLARSRGDLAQAEQYFHQALNIDQKLFPDRLRTAFSFRSLGKLARERKDLATAAQYYQQALTILEKLAPDTRDHAETLAELASLYREQPDLVGAERFYAQALATLERQISLLGGSQETRSGFRARYVDYYREYGEVLLAEGKKEAAFLALERSRSRSFLEMLAQRDIVFADLASENRLALKENHAAYNQLQAQLETMDTVNDKARADELRMRMSDLIRQRDEIIDRVKQASPRLAALQYPKPLDADVARNVLDSGTVLLSYSVGKNYTELFVLQPAGVDPGMFTFRLPIGEKALRRQIADFRRSIQSWSTSANYQSQLQSRMLYDLLLRPAEGQIARADRILISPDGPLHILPFAALRRNKRQYLIEWKPLHYILSATVYGEIKNARRERGVQPVELVAFGDPNQGSDQIKAELQRNLTLRTAVSRGLHLSELPSSRDEVNNIAALYPGRSQVYLGNQATEERALTIGKGVLYIDFATHAFVDDRFPLDSALVLSIPQNPGAGQEDGMLQAWEILEQVRIDADLVTLSAYETGLGKDIDGEGIIGLTRAFQYAGAHSVAASLWNVPDVSTAELIKRLYINIRSGQSKDEALREAQLELMRMPRFKRPFHWAAFVLSGDWL